MESSELNMKTEECYNKYFNRVKIWNLLSYF